MSNIWQRKWYEKRSFEFLEERYERKSMALAFIIVATIFVTVTVTRLIIGRPFDLPLFFISLCFLAVGTVWFRIAYCSQEELKRRGALKDGKIQSSFRK